MHKRMTSGQDELTSEEALRLFATSKQARRSKATQLHAEIEEGLVDIRAGKIVDFDPDAVKRNGRVRLVDQASKK